MAREKRTEKVTVQTEQKKAYEPTYSVEELAIGAKAQFNTEKIIVRAALKETGKDTFTLKEAEKIITKFKNKEAE